MNHNSNWQSDAIASLTAIEWAANYELCIKYFFSPKVFLGLNLGFPLNGGPKFGLASPGNTYYITKKLRPQKKRLTTNNLLSFGN